MRLATFTSLLLAVGLAACGSTHDDDSGFAGSKANAYSLFDPVATSAIIPFPFDGLFNGTSDGTLNIPNGANDDAVPFVTAANQLDGFSTTASLFTDFIGYIDVGHALDINAVTAAGRAADRRLDAHAACPRRRLPRAVLEGHRFRNRPAAQPFAHAHADRTAQALKPATRYIAAVTRQVQSTDGVPVEAADLFRVVRSTTPVASQDESALSV